MLVYRLSREKYKNELSGRGAATQGGRWNNKGVEVVYTAASRALAMAEVLVHSSLQDIPRDYYMLTIYHPDHIAHVHVSEDLLPAGWNLFPYSQATQSVSELFFQRHNHGVLRVPSAVVKGDYNYLLDPANKNFDQVKILEEEKFPFYDRLVFGLAR